MSQMDVLRVLKLYRDGLPSFYIGKICNMVSIKGDLSLLKKKGFVNFSGWPHPIWKITDEGLKSDMYINLREDPRILKKAIEVLGYGPNEQLKIKIHLTDEFGNDVKRLKVNGN